MAPRTWFMIFLLILPSITPGFLQAGESPTSPPALLKASLQESHVIKGVPYVAQTEMNYCPYACLTMVFNYMGLNTSLDELLFYTGAGYTHTYRPEQRLPHADMWGGFEFMQSLFGVTERSWAPQDHNLSDDERWAQFYTRMKENIISDVPVITMVDPFSLPSLRNQFNVSDFIWKVMFPSGHHVIVVVGYNDSNQSICYNDPNAGYYGDGRYGTYAWMPQSVFRQAHERVGIYLLMTYVQTGAPLSKNDAFDMAFERNIDNLTGTQEHTWYSGINASVRMYLDFSPGENQSQTTGHMYKVYGSFGLNYTVDLVIHWLWSHIDPLHPNIYDMIMAGKQDAFGAIAAAKNHTAQYLAQCTAHPDLCRNQSALLLSESEQWRELSTYYSVFMRRGLFLSSVRAAFVMRHMEPLVKDIITIEKTLITQS